MMLSDELIKRTKEELVDYAESLGISDISKLNKEQLAVAFEEHLMDQKKLSFRLFAISEKRINLLKKVIRNKVKITNEQAFDYYKLYKDYFIFEDSGFYYIPDDYKSIMNNLLNSSYSLRQQKMNWLYQCIVFASDFYGIYKMNELMRLLNLNKRFEFEKDDTDIIERIIEALHFSISVGDIFVSETAFKYGYRKLKTEQKNKKLFIPTTDQISFYYDNRYLLNQQYEALKRALLKITDDIVITNTYLSMIFRKTLSGVPEHNIIDSMSDILELMDESDALGIISLIIKAYEHTNLMSNRGKTPTDTKKDLR